MSDDTLVADLLRPIRRTTRAYWALILGLGLVVSVGVFAYLLQLRSGLQVTAMRNQVSWGIYIANFVFFIGISHVGALMSAILRLSGAEWRRPITRMAEAVTVCSLAVGAAMPIIDLGRPDRLLNVVTMGRLQSAILWDFLSIFTYLTGSVLFLYLFLIPDVALMRDRLTRLGPWKRKLYRVLSLGWTGTANQKRRLERSIGVMTLLILPIAISVHTVVSWIFAMTLRVGWNSSIFGPYFVAGALFSGVATVLLAMAVFRRTFHLEKYITERHFRNLALILLVLDLVYIYFTINEYLVVSYKMESSESLLLQALYTGEYAGMFWAIQFFGLIVPAVLLAIPRTRTSTAGIIVAAVLINGAMWLKRYLIVVSSLAAPGVPIDWGAYFPTWVEWSITAAGFAGFALLFALFAKVFPIISIWELREEKPEAEREAVPSPSEART